VEGEAVPSRMETNKVTLSKFKVWLLAARPKTLWAGAAPVLIGTAMAFGDRKMHWPSALAAAFGAVMIQIGTNYANDYSDFKRGTDEGKRVGPTRATQAGWVTPSAMFRAAGFTFGLAALAGVYLIMRGGWVIAAIGALSILSGILYTAGPYPLGYHGLGDFFVFVFFGPVAVGGTYFVQALGITPEVLLAGVAPGLLSVAILTVNNLRDLSSDKEAGKRTLAVKFGAGFARWEYLLCIVGAMTIPAVLFRWTKAHGLAMLTIACGLGALPAIGTVFRLQDDPELNDVLASTGKLIILYSVVFSMGWLL